jgi:mRNA-degrading endonuclease toxin of MazEF toxin-antitoxin module
VTPHRGYLYWASHIPSDPKRRRPVLVVSPDKRNELATNVVVIPASTVRRIGPWNVALRRGEGGLPAPSVLKCEEVSTVPKAWLAERPLGGPLSETRLREVAQCLVRAIDLPFYD